MQSHTVANIHKKTFGEYKNRFYGKDIAIIATGPSLNNYKNIENTINIGVNKSFLKDNINLDFLFAQDYYAIKDYIDLISNPKYQNIQKFYGSVSNRPYGLKEIDSSILIIPESLRLRHNAKKYFLYSKWPAYPIAFNPDIDTTFLTDGRSVVFSAMQFALFTNPKRIYLIGCDCTSGYFDNTVGADASILIEGWKQLKKFADTYYPETEIISVNPKGLKGIFKDLYQ